MVNGTEGKEIEYQMACFPWSLKSSVSKLRPKCVNPFSASSNPWIGDSSPCGQPDLADATSLTLIRSHPRSPVRLCTKNGNPLHCSCLENPRDGGARWAAVYGVAQSRTRLKRLSSSSPPTHRHGLWMPPALCPLCSQLSLILWFLMGNVVSSGKVGLSFLTMVSPWPPPGSAQTRL